MADVVPDTKSRYKTAGSAFAGQLSPEDVPGLVASLRKTFRSEKTYSYEWRISQLRALRRMLVEEEGAICAALYEDLHKSPQESYLSEIGTTLGEIDTALSELSHWMKPHYVRNSQFTAPGWCSIQADPLGVVLVFGSWNYPFYLSLGPVIGAIAAGNCVILKPGSYAVKSSHVMVNMLTKYMDQSAFRVVEGNRKVTEALLQERFDKIFFTGSGFVGKVVARAAAEHLTPCVLELGGKSPAIIDKSIGTGAELTHCVERIVWGAFLNGGQTCVRPDFALVHADIAPEFYKAFKEVCKRFFSEDPSKTEFFARCINESAYSRLSELVKTHKANVVAGGRFKAEEKYVEPTLLDFGNDLKAFREQEVMLDEIFGPIIPSARWKDIEEVIDFVKDLRTGKPLALYGFGTDKAFAEALKKRTTSGGLVINDCLVHLTNDNMPFGGVGASGMGSYHGKASFDCFSHQKSVLEKNATLESYPIVRKLLEARFPPYTPEKIKMIRILTHPIVGKITRNVPFDSMTFLAKLFAVYFVFRVLGYKFIKN